MVYVYGVYETVSENIHTHRHCIGLLTQRVYRVYRARAKVHVLLAETVADQMYANLAAAPRHHVSQVIICLVNKPIYDIIKLLPTVALAAIAIRAVHIGSVKMMESHGFHDFL